MTLFVTRPKCFITGNVGSAASGKVKTFTGSVLGLLLFFLYSQKFSIDTPESFILLSFTTVKLLKEVKPAPGCKMMKLLTVDKFFQSLDTRIRMTTGFAFSYLVTLVLA